jgi:cytochrome b6-f complex iron-sulfur subunit
MTRKDFISQVGKSAALLLVPACITGLNSCKKSDSSTKKPKIIDFTLDISSGPLATNGGALITDGVIVARTTTGDFIAVDSDCTHQNITVNYVPSNNSFHCSGHGSNFDANGNVTTGPAVNALTSFHTSLSGNSLHVFS